MAKAAATTTSQPETIWNYLYTEIKNKYGVAGLMGNLYAESALLSINVQNGYGYDDLSYTNNVDNGTYKNFVNDSIGYGLAQWTYYTRKRNLKSYADQNNASIGNLEMQLGFLVKELKESYTSVWNTLTSAKSVKEASNAVLLNFERPANSGTSVQNQRAEYGEKYYKEYENSTSAVAGSDETVTLNLSYDRATDPLLLEFGYANQVSNSSDANMGSYLKAQSSKGTYPVSAVNMADMLLDIFDIWGFNVSSGSGTQVEGKVTTKSGKVLTSGTKIEIPSDIKQTGLIADYTIYPTINWSKNTTQRTIFDTWKSEDSKSSHNIATLNGYYLIALTSHVGGCVGNIVEIHTEDGSMFQGIMADEKSAADSDSNKYGHVKGSSGTSVVEWEIMNGVSHSTVNSSLEDWGIYGKKVEYVIQFGTWLQ